MVTMPALGEWADRHAAKKKLLMAVTAGCVLTTAALAWVGPGQVALGLGLLILSNTFFSFGESLTASFLPELAKPEAMGRVSGWGWALGYIGGMLTLGVCLAYVLAAPVVTVLTDRIPRKALLIGLGVALIRRRRRRVQAKAAPVPIKGSGAGASTMTSEIKNSFESY
jgi:UMF1 family MFS transporter